MESLMPENKENPPDALIQTSNCKMCGEESAFMKLPWSIIRTVVLLILIVLCVTICVVFEHQKSDQEIKRKNEDEKFKRDMVKEINEKQNLWKAEYNKFAVRKRDTPDNDPDFPPKSWKAYNKKLVTDNLDTVSTPHWQKLIDQKIGLPRFFDARKEWPFCWTVDAVLNQAGCGSCWAAAATSIMSDRICIKSNGTQKPQISIDDLIGCCEKCGDCMGSTDSVLPAFQHWVENGIVTGGPYSSEEGCRPYSQAPTCGWPCSPAIYDAQTTPTCQAQACQASYFRDYESDKYYGSSAYFLSVAWVPHGLLKPERDYEFENLVKKEVMLNGPVVACFFVFEDFQHYRSGIYKQMLGEMLYGHCCKLIGWGDENGEKYWVFTNSWGRNWGENGHFRIAFTGLHFTYANHTDSIPEVTAGLPKL